MAQHIDTFIHSHPQGCSTTTSYHTVYTYHQAERPGEERYVTVEIWYEVVALVDGVPEDPEYAEAVAADWRTDHADDDQPSPVCYAVWETTEICVGPTEYDLEQTSYEEHEVDSWDTPDQAEARARELHTRLDPSMITLA